MVSRLSSSVDWTCLSTGSEDLSSTTSSTASVVRAALLASSLKSAMMSGALSSLRRRSLTSEICAVVAPDRNSITAGVRVSLVGVVASTSAAIASTISASISDSCDVVVAASIRLLKLSSCPMDSVPGSRFITVSSRDSFASERLSVGNDSTPGSATSPASISSRSKKTSGSPLSSISLVSSSRIAAS